MPKGGPVFMALVERCSLRMRSLEISESPIVVQCEAPERIL